MRFIETFATSISNSCNHRWLEISLANLFEAVKFVHVRSSMLPTQLMFGISFFHCLYVIRSVASVINTTYREYLCHIYYLFMYKFLAKNIHCLGVKCDESFGFYWFNCWSLVIGSQKQFWNTCVYAIQSNQA